MHVGPAGFPIGIPLRGIARNCSRIARNYAQFLGVYMARICAQVKSTCAGNPNINARVSIKLKNQASHRKDSSFLLINY